MAVTEYGETTAKLFSTVTQAIDRAGMIAARIGSAQEPNLREASFSHDINPINLDEPPKFSDLFAGADTGDALIAGLNDKVDAWLAKYFPSINGQFQNVPEDYLVGVISGAKPFGIESTVFDLVWHKARDRAYRTTNSERATLMAAFSSRGFTLPPGALAAQMAAAEQRATDAVLDVSRDQAIKDADIKADILKHAVGIATQLKTSILSTSAEFFKAYYSVYGMDNEKARIRAQAYQSYYNALSSYYNVEVQWEKLRMDSQLHGAGIDLAVDRNRISVYSGNGVAGAHAEASRGFANIAAQSANAAGTLVATIENV